MTTVRVPPAQQEAQHAIPAQRISAARVPFLDGLRGLAILGVVVLHALSGAPYASAFDDFVGKIASFGWMGVDLLFVLSGYLITGILIDARARPRYFSTFYARRLLQSLPVYVVFLAFLMCVAPRVGAIEPAAAEHLQTVQR
jgi:peptidoglycan/LPS O-acetylase OafA/YrhL